MTPGNHYFSCNIIGTKRIPLGIMIKVWRIEILITFFLSLFLSFSGGLLVVLYILHMQDRNIILITFTPRIILLEKVRTFVFFRSKLNITNTVLLQGWFWQWIIPEGLCVIKQKIKKKSFLRSNV